MATLAKDFKVALKEDYAVLRKKQKVMNGRTHANKSAYHLRKQVEEFKSFVKPYGSFTQMLKNIFWEPLKAKGKLGYGLYNLFVAIGDKKGGARALYGSMLILRSLAHLLTSAPRIVSRLVATLVNFLVEVKGKPTKQSTNAKIHEFMTGGEPAKKEEDKSKKIDTKAEEKRLKEYTYTPTFHSSPALPKPQGSKDCPFAFMADDAAAIDFSQAAF